MKKLSLLLVLWSACSFASEPVGYYNQGSLINGECLQESGEGYVQLLRDVGHIYGTSQMIDMLEQTASDMKRRYPGRDRLEIEDIAAKNGGDIDPHGSHENGQDVDIQYFKANNVEERGYAPSMVSNGSVSSNFDVERNWELMKSLHRHGSVQMIFMDTVIKNQLIAYARSKNEYSSNLKVINSFHYVPNHDDHLHVRLNCPASARSCHSSTVRKGGAE